jgi:hypothetical protein
MRKLAITPVLLLLIACTGDPAAPGPAPLRGTSLAVVRDTYRVDLPFNFVLTPSQFPCLTEALQFSGTIEEHLVFVQNSGRIHVTIHQTTNNVTVTGLTTGDRYAFSGPLTFSASGPIAPEPLVFTFHNINHVVGPGGDSNLFVRTLEHVTRDATGAVKVSVFKDEVLCH